jgi:hypothetical protein
MFTLPIFTLPIFAINQQKPSMQWLEAATLGRAGLGKGLEGAGPIDFFADKADRQRLSADDDAGRFAEAIEVIHQGIDDPSFWTVDDEALLTIKLQAAQAQRLDKHLAQPIQLLLAKNLQILSRKLG